MRTRFFIPRFLHLLVLGCLVARQAVLWRRSSPSLSVSSQRSRNPQRERIHLPPPRISAATASNGFSNGAAAAFSPLELPAVKTVATTEVTRHDTKLLPVGYDPPLSTLSFCVPWTVDTDEWWTHHPAWEVGLDNATHTCYRRRSPSEARAMTNLYNVQFFHRTTGDKNDADAAAKANCTYRRMWSDGFASDLRNVLDGVLESHREGRPFSYDATPWHYAALQDGNNPVCATKTMACYFLPLGSCPLDRQLPQRSELFHRPPPFGKHRAAVEYVLRPRQWLRRRVQLYARQVRHELLHQAAVPRGNRTTSSSSSSCTVVHVRRGDVVLGGSHTSQRSYKPLSDYVRHIPAALDATVLLLTDDANAIDETLLFPHISWIYFNRTRYRGSEGGWEEHLPSRNPATEVVALFSALDVVPHCNTLVHTASNFAQLLYYKMTASHRRVRRVNLGK